MTERGFGVTRACGLVGISRSLYRYESRRPDAALLRSRIEEIAALKRRYGYRLMCPPQQCQVRVSKVRVEDYLISVSGDVETQIPLA
jgi:hypothetical protein